MSIWMWSRKRFARILVVAVFAALSIAIAALAIQPAQAPPEDKTYQVTTAHAEQEIALFTRVLAYVGVAQVLLALVYGFFAFRQWQAIRDQTNLTERIAQANRTAAEAAKENADLARQMLILTQRPKLIVRNVVIQQPNMVHVTVPPDIKPNQLFIWQLYTSNVGGTTATIREVGCWIFLIAGELPMARPYEGRDGNTAIVPGKLSPGESGTLHIALTTEYIEGGQDPLESLEGIPKQQYVYVMGWVTYADEAGIIRRTAFCRRYDWARQHFVIVDNPDYEHSE